MYQQSIDFSFLTAELYSLNRYSKIGFHADGHLGYFQFGAIQKKAAMNACTNLYADKCLHFPKVEWLDHGKVCA